MNLTNPQTLSRSERTATRPDRKLHVIAGTRPRSSASAGEVVLAYLRLQAGALTALEPQVRSEEPDAVHEMRVATRRLRAAFRSFGSVIPRPRSAEVIEALDSPRYAALRVGLDLLTSEPPLGPKAAVPARKVLPAGVERVYHQAARRMRRAQHTPPGPAQDVALHHARKSARRARYAAEAARPAAGRPAGQFSQQMKKVQSILGDHQDTILARQATRELGIGAHLAGENAFSYGLLYQDQTHLAERLRRQARTTWNHAARRRNRRWLP